MKPIHKILPSIFLAPVIWSLQLYGAEIKYTPEVERTIESIKGISLKAIPTYQIAAYRFNRETSKKLADGIFKNSSVTKNLKDKNFTVNEDDDEVLFSSGNIEYRIAKKTGAEMLLDLNRYAVAQKTQQEFGDAALKKIAGAYMKETFTDVKSDAFAAIKIKKLMDGQGKYDPETKKITEESSNIAQYEVIYERKIGVLPVFGSGEKIRVYISSNGDVIGHSKVWRKIAARPIATKPTIVFDRVKKIFEAKHVGEKIDIITVDRLYFGYFAEGRFTSQFNLRPYYMVGFTYGPNSKRVLERYDAYTGFLILPPGEKDGDIRKQLSP